MDIDGIKIKLKGDEELSTLQIKTITCHNVYNHGASLQEYALLQYFKNIGYQAETINYNPDYLSNHFNFLSVSNPKFNSNLLIRSIYLLLKLPGRLLGLRRKYNFDKFSDKYISTTRESFTSNQELKDNIPEADVFICGSDQIWNSFFQNGKDPAFYLDFVPEDKLKISYAASFATETIEENIKPFVSEKVKRIDFVSVRESSGVTILKDLGFTNIKHVLDPVFLLDRKSWEEIASQEKVKKPYILVYDADSNPSIKDFVLSMSKKNKWDIITISNRIPYADKNLSSKGPDVFLSLIKEASFIVSNSFHAVAFSLIFEKQFVVFSRAEQINTRMRDLVNMLNIKETMLPYKTMQDEYQHMIDYKNVKPILKNHIKKSKQFLIDSIQKEIN